MNPPSEPSPSGKGQSILLIDDETAILEITKETLEVYGYTVITAENGADGLAVYEAAKERIAVALVDSNMPGMDGVETIQRLHAINPALKVISVSGQSEEEMRETTPGASGFLTKPYSIATLLKLLDSVLSGGTPQT